MEISNEIQQSIVKAQNICLIPKDEPESLSAALAFFYTLSQMGKNVNLVIDNFPENLNYLIPSADFLTRPKNFVISIPRTAADISQVYYEKTDENLKIHLTTNSGQLKKENISFYFNDAKPDLIISLGILDFKKYLENNLDSHGFLLGSAILNIDNNSDNLKYGQFNLIEDISLSEIVLNFIKSFDESLISKNVAECLLLGLISHYQNFQSKKTKGNTFQIAADLIKKGANNQQLAEILHKKPVEETVSK